MPEATCMYIIKGLRVIGRFYTRGRIIHLDELGQTFVVRPVMRL